MADEVGDRRVAQHAPAVGQRVQLKRSTWPSARLMLIGVESPARIISVRSRDEGAQFVLRQFVGAGVAAVIHQRDERRLAVGLLVGQREIIAEGAVDEFGAGVGIEQHDADVDLVERRRQPRRRWHGAPAPRRTRRSIFAATGR